MKLRPNESRKTHSLRRSRRAFGLGIVLVSAMALSGCLTTTSNELEDVAKRWSETIRASQVLPVYPPRRDILPGLVLVVPVSMSEQQKLYHEDGFLPITQELTQLYNFRCETPGPDVNDASGPQYLETFNASFPTYSFEISRNTGLDLAVPLNGISLGFGLMNSDKAHVSVSLNDAYTCGISGESAFWRLLQWQNDSAYAEIRKKTLGAIATQVSSDVFLRVVTRVYFIKSISVAINNDAATDVGTNYGFATDAATLDLTTITEADIKQRSAALRALLKEQNQTANQLLGGAKAGASVSFNQISSSTVGMTGTFDEPLAIGFTGFDVKVNADGQLSAPIPSFTVLSDELTTPNFKFEDWLANQIDDSKQESSSVNAEAYRAWYDKTPNAYMTVRTYLDGVNLSNMATSDITLVQNAQILDDFMNSLNR